MCDCVEKQTEKIREHFGDPMACLTTSGFNFRFELEVSIPFEYSVKRKNGSLKTIHESLAAKYCPFCGQKYGEE